MAGLFDLQNPSSGDYDEGYADYLRQHSTVYALFEELKLKIEQLSISNKSANQTVTNADAKEIIQSVQELQNRIIHEGVSSQQIKELRTSLVQASAYTNGKVNDMLLVVTKELKTAIHSITNKEIQEEAEGKPIIQKGHVFKVDFRSRKAIITMLVMAALILLSGADNIRQNQVSQKLRDNDLKYRYVKMKREANPEDIIWLETIFKHDRNWDSIAVVRGQVERHEEAIKSKNTQWYVFFTVYDTQLGKVFLVRFISNNHMVAQHLL